jgi:glycosyltransferase involved in cell wall biosynthesis
MPVDDRGRAQAGDGVLPDDGVERPIQPAEPVAQMRPSADQALEPSPPACILRPGVRAKIQPQGATAAGVACWKECPVFWGGGRIEVAQLYARCRALVLSGEEDFGITPIEANAAGRPVVAYAAGGALDTTVDGETGVLFAEQSVAGLCRAVERVQSISWDPCLLMRHAERFSEENFRDRLLGFLNASWDARSSSTGTSERGARPRT